MGYRKPHGTWALCPSWTSLLMKTVLPRFNYKFGHCEDHSPSSCSSIYVAAALWCTERWCQWIFQKGQFSSFPHFLPRNWPDPTNSIFSTGLILEMSYKVLFLELSTSHRTLYMQPNETTARIISVSIRPVGPWLIPLSFQWKHFTSCWKGQF